MRAYAYTGAPHAQVDELRSLGATLFDDMLALPDLLEAP
jgi:hypothetical protein